MVIISATIDVVAVICARINDLKRLVYYFSYCYLVRRHFSSMKPLQKEYGPCKVKAAGGKGFGLFAEKAIQKLADVIFLCHL